MAMNSSALRNDKSGKEEKFVPQNLLTPEELEYMRRKRKESIKLAKKLLPNLKTREELESPNPASEESKVPHNFLTTSEKELLKRKMKESGETYKKLSNGRVKLRSEKNED